MGFFALMGYNIAGLGYPMNFPPIEKFAFIKASFRDEILRRLPKMNLKSDMSESDSGFSLSFKLSF